jgi:hypothetical protein
MPLASWFSLQWYGPCAAAMVAEPGVGYLHLGEPHQNVRAALDVSGVGDAPLLRPYRMRNAAFTVDAAGTLHFAEPHKIMRAGLQVLVSELSADDVTGAVLESFVEGTLTLKQAIRLLLAHAAGDATGLDGNPAFKSMDGATTRLAGTISAGSRTITTRNPG